jgi:hypothetical protein
MTPAQKLKMGKEIAKDIGLRYKFEQSGKKEKTLYEAVTKDENRVPEGLKYFFSWANVLFQKYEKMDVLRLLVEKGCIEEKNLQEYVNQQFKSVRDKHTFDSMIEKYFPMTLGHMSPEQAQKYIWEVNGRESARRKKMQMVFDYLYVGQRRQINTKEETEILQKLEELRENKDKPEERAEEIEQEFLKSIEDKWKSGELKHTLLNHTPKVKKRKTTLARAVPLNHLYPEKMKKQLDEEVQGYTATEIMGLENVTLKQFQALQFLAHKAQNQTEDDKKVLKAWDEIAGETHRGYRIVPFKESEYVTQSQGKDSSMVSNNEKNSCMKAIDEIKDIEFTVRWEEKTREKQKGRESSKKKTHVLVRHPLIKTLTPKNPWTLVKEEKDAKEVKKYQFIAIPERLFEYQETDKGDKRFFGARVLFDVINIDPDFFTTLKYSDPEVQHVSGALMKLSLVFLIEGSFGRNEFIIDDEKLLKRVGLLDESRRIGRAKTLLDTYIKKLINHGTLDSEEKRDNKRIVKFPPKEKKN